MHLPLSTKSIFYVLSLLDWIASETIPNLDDSWVLYFVLNLNNETCINLN